MSLAHKNVNWTVGGTIVSFQKWRLIRNDISMTRFRVYFHLGVLGLFFCFPHYCPHVICTRKNYGSHYCYQRMEDLGGRNFIINLTYDKRNKLNANFQLFKEKNLPKNDVIIKSYDLLSIFTDKPNSYTAKLYCAKLSNKMIGLSINLHPK